MKPLVKKILEAGLVDKHVAKMMERWGTLEPNSSDLVGQRKVTETTLQEFADDIEYLIEKGSEEGKQETSLEIGTGEGFTIRWFCLERHMMMPVWKDTMGNLIALKKFMPPGAGFVRGEQLDTIIGKSYRVLDIDPIAVGESITAYRLAVEEL
jgi:hypothetical protein